jgi:hypothetical protein
MEIADANSYIWTSAINLNLGLLVLLLEVFREEFQAGVDTELVKDAHFVVLHRRLAQVQPRRDFLTGDSSEQQFIDLLALRGVREMVHRKRIKQRGRKSLAQKPFLPRLNHSQLEAC